MLQNYFSAIGYINDWNMLSDEIIAGNLLTGFKRKLDRRLRDLYKLI